MQMLQTDAVLDEQVTQVSVIAGRLVGDIYLEKCSDINAGTPWRHTEWPAVIEQSISDQHHHITETPMFQLFLFYNTDTGEPTTK